MRCPNCKNKVPKQYMNCPRCGLSVKAARASGRRNAALTAICLTGVIAIGGGMIARSILRNSAQTEPDTQVVAEASSAAETTAAVTDAPPETTAAVTTAAPETTPAPATTKATEKETAATTAETTKAATKPTTTKPADTQKTKPQTDADGGNTAADYYKTIGAAPFHTYDSGDPFLPPGIYTRSDNADGRALSEANAKQAMMQIGIDWGKNADLYCGDSEDASGSTNSTYRYITNAFPVPGYSDLQLPAAVDLYIHNGDAYQGSYLRAVDYRFGNHGDYTGPYIWTREEIEKIFNGVAEYADGVYGGHTVINDSNLAHYDYFDGVLSMGYYESGGKYVFWLSRAND